MCLIIAILLLGYNACKRKQLLSLKKLIKRVSGMDCDKKHEMKKIRDLFDGAICLLSCDGIKGLTMDRVPMEAGVAKGVTSQII